VSPNLAQAQQSQLNLSPARKLPVID